MNSESFEDISADCNSLIREDLRISIPRFLELIVDETHLCNRELIYCGFINCIKVQSQNLSQAKRRISEIKTALKNPLLLETNFNKPNLQECHQALLDLLENITIQGTGKLPPGEAYFLVVDPRPNTSSAWVKKVKVFYGEDKEYTKTTEKAAIVVRRSHAYVMGYLTTKYALIEKQTGWWFDDPDGRGSYLEYDDDSHGLATAIAYIALFLNLGVPSDVAITGALGANGEVIKVGGIEKKIPAAYYSQINRVIIPKENRETVNFCEDPFDENFSIVRVNNFEECLNEVFGAEEINEAIEDVVGVRKYLECLIKEVERHIYLKSLNKRYDDLGLDINKYIPLKLRLCSKNFEYEQESSKDKNEVEIQEVLDNYPSVIIEGPSGSGKTTLLEYIAYELASQYLNKNHTGKIAIKDDETGQRKKLIPIRVLMPELAKNDIPSLKEYIQSEQALYELPESFTEWMNKAVNAGNCIVLLDGDEVEKDLRQKVTKKIELIKGRKIVASRPTTGISISGTRFELLRLSYTQIHDFIINKIFKDQKEKGLSLIDVIENQQKSLRVLLETPLLLAIMTSIFDSDYQTATQKVKYRKILKTDLYDEFSDILLESWQKHKPSPNIHEVSKSEKESFLAKIAYKFFLQKTFNEPEIDKIGIEKLEILKRVGHDYAFIHSSFHEYYAAKHIKAERLYRDLLNKDESWDEVIIFYCGMVDDNLEDLSFILEYFLKQDTEESNPRLILLSGKCLNAVKKQYKNTLGDIKDRILNALFGVYNSNKSEWFLKQQALNVLAEIEEPDVEDFFIEIIKSDDIIKQRQVLRVLPKGEFQDLPDILVENISNGLFDHNIRQAAIEAINRMGFGKELMNILRDPKQAVLHSSIVKSLENTYNSEVIEILREFLNDIEAMDPPADFDLKELMCKVIGEKGNNDDDVERLINKLGNDKEIKHILIEALSNNPCEKTLQYLVSELKASKYQDPTIVRSLGKILSEKEDLEAIGLLKNALIKKNSTLESQKTIVEALANISSNDTIQFLLEYFDNTRNKETKIKIIELLSSKSEFNQRLINCLGKKNLPDIRLAAIEAISKGHCLNADSSLRQIAFKEILSILNQSNPGPNPNNFKIAAMKALTILKNKSDVNQLLKVFKKHFGIPEFSESAIICTCKLYIHDVDEKYLYHNLSSLLVEYSDAQLQTAVISEIVKAKTILQGNQEIINLLELLVSKGKDEGKHDVTRNAIEALAELGNSKTIRLLEKMKMDRSYSSFEFDFNKAIENLKAISSYFI